MSTFSLASLENSQHKVFQEGLKRGMHKGKIEVRAETKKEFVLNMLKAGISAQQIADITGLSIEQVKFVSNGNKWSFSKI